MRIFEVPSRRAGVPTRLGVQGSCRVYDPFEALAATGRILKVWAGNNSSSYTLGEACQMLQHCADNATISPPLFPFVFDEPQGIPPWTPSLRRMLQDVDVFVVEVSGLRELCYRNTFFQQQVFTRNLVSKYNPALLPWYRAFSTGEVVGEELVRSTLSRMPALADPDKALIESILREVRLTPLNVEGARKRIEAMTSSWRARWIFVSHFIVDGLPPSHMQDRLQARDVLHDATAACGVDFFDPTAVVQRYGRNVALAKSGADLYHYDPAFLPVMAEALLDKVDSMMPRTETSGATRGPASDDRPVEATAASLNDLLVALHRDRVMRLGLDGSGLYAYYASLLERKLIIRKQEIDLVDFILRCVPAFDSYHVLRAGLGEIAILLAAFDCETVAADPFRTRFEAIVAGKEDIEARGLIVKGKLSATEEVVPSVRKRGRTIAIATQLAMTVSAAEEDDILRRLEEYDALVFCPTMLVRQRTDATEEEALLQRFRRAGFTSIRDYPQLGVVYCGKAGVNELLPDPHSGFASVAA